MVFGFFPIIFRFHFNLDFLRLMLILQRFWKEIYFFLRYRKNGGLLLKINLLTFTAQLNIEIEIYRFRHQFIQQKAQFDVSYSKLKLNLNLITNLSWDFKLICNLNTQTSF